VRRIEEGGALRAVWVVTDGVVIMLERSLRGAGPPSGSGHVLAFEASDLASWEERLAASAVPIDDRTAETLFIRDPDGHRVGLSAHRFPLSSSSPPADPSRRFTIVIGAPPFGRWTCSRT
jgi:hypothetical protein